VRSLRSGATALSLCDAAALELIEGDAQHADERFGHRTPALRAPSMVNNYHSAASPLESRPMRVSAKADYAVRAMVELAACGASEHSPAKGDRIAEAQLIPLRFLENILGELRQHGLVHSRRGPDGGYWLGREPDDLTLADVIRAVEGPLATVRGDAAESLDYTGDAESLREVWLALRANIRQVLESVTLADVVSGELPEPIGTLAAHPEATQPRIPSRFAHGPDGP
jgi:Rrf2 family protein